MDQKLTTHSIFKCRALTLIELLLVIAIIGILLAFGLPSYNDARQRQKLNGLADNLHFFMKLAKAEAAKKSRHVFVVLNQSSSKVWCIGLSDSDNQCNCRLTRACQVDNIERVISSSDYQNVSYESTFFDDLITIEAYRGRSPDTGSITFSMNSGTAQKNIRIIRSVMGRDRICSPLGTSHRHPKC